jgi:hypothetical protein
LVFSNHKPHMAQCLLHTACLNLLLFFPFDIWQKSLPFFSFSISFSLTCLHECLVFIILIILNICSLTLGQFLPPINVSGSYIFLKGTPQLFLKVAIFSSIWSISLLFSTVPNLKKMAFFPYEETTGLVFLTWLHQYAHL